MFCLGNLLRRKTRSILTLLGVAVGVSLFSASDAVMTAFRDQTLGLVKNRDVDMIVLAKNASTPIHSRVERSLESKLADLVFVAGAYPMIMGTVKTDWNPYFAVFGLPWAESLSGRLAILDGEPFISGRRELIMGRLAFQRLEKGVGSKLKFREGEVFHVSGIYACGHGLVDGAVIMDLTDAGRVLNRLGDDFVNAVLIQLRPGFAPAAAAAEINRLFPQLTAVRGAELMDKIRLSSVIEAVCRLIMFITLGASSLIVMNTQLMAVSERTAEIGILAAVGWPPRRIMGLIILEAVILSVVGAALGNLIGLAELQWFSRLDSIGFGWVPTGLSGGTAAASLLLALAAGIAGSLYPAWVAVRMNPAEALRRE
ncbi:MAG: FtsX-like permease family protein [Pseudomonadota bacterium]